MRFDHFHLRPLEGTDGPALFQLIDHERARLADFFAGLVGITRTLPETEAYLTSILTRADERNYFAFALEDTRTRRLAGFVDIKNIDWKVPKAELGAFVAAAYEGQGLASQALAAITRHGFEELGLVKLLVRTHERNTGARRAIERNGYTLEGSIRKDYRTTSGEVVDLLYYGRVR